MLRNGLRMLKWLLAIETRDGHLSGIPTGMGSRREPARFGSAAD